MVERKNTKNNSERIFANSIFLWEKISKIANSKLMKLTVFMPVLGYLILFGDEYQKYFHISSQFINSDINKSFLIEIVEFFNLSTQTRLYFFYYGFSSLAIGYIIFNLYCPILFKENFKKEEYLKDSLNSMHFGMYEFLINKVSKNYLPDSETERLHRIRKSAEEKYKKVNNSHFEINEIEGYKLLILSLNWEYSNTLNKFSRACSAIFIFLGLLLLAIPTFSMIVSVTLGLII